MKESDFMPKPESGNELLAEHLANFEKTIAEYEAGKREPSYLAELLDWLNQDLHNAEEAELPEVVAKISEKIAEIEALLPDEPEPETPPVQEHLSTPEVINYLAGCRDQHSADSVKETVASWFFDRLDEIEEGEGKKADKEAKKKAFASEIYAIYREKCPDGKMIGYIDWLDTLADIHLLGKKKKADHANAPQRKLQK